MGLKFFENNGGNKMFYCAGCNAYLADRASLVSTSFTGVTGQAFLFSRAFNVVYGGLALRQMMTGNHYVRDVFCGCCDEHLGWMYEKAPDDKEKYKEGSVIFERLLIIESEGITKSNQMDRRPDPPRQPHRRRAMLAEMERIEHENHHPNERRRQLVNVFRRQHIPDVPYFSTVNNEIPQIPINDEVALLAILGERTLDVFKRTLRRFNIALARCAERDNNRDLESMGFRPEFCRNFREIETLMNGEPYVSSPQADRSLIELFQRMQHERDRLQLREMDLERAPPRLPPMPNAERNALRREVFRAQIAMGRRNRRPIELRDDEIDMIINHQPPRDPDQQRPQELDPVAMIDDAELDLMIRQRMEEFRVNVVDPAVVPAVLQEQNRRIQEWEELVGQQDESDDDDDVDPLIA